jgi:hypothetical protein
LNDFVFPSALELAGRSSGIASPASFEKFLSDERIFRSVGTSNERDDCHKS